MSFEGAQLAFRRQNTVRLTVVTVGNDIAAVRRSPRFRPDPAGYCQYMPSAAGCRFLAAWLWRAFQRRDAVNAYHAAAHPRLEADDKIRTFYRLPDRIGDQYWPC